MSNLFIFTGSNGLARQHFQDTIERPIDMNLVKEYLREDEFSALDARVGDGDVFAWGAKPGRRNESNWNELAVGDFILAYAQQ